MKLSGDSRLDTQLFQPAPRDDAVRERLGWDGRASLLTVGRLQKRKGHDMLISALPRIRESIPEVVYAVVGGGEELPALQRLVEKMNLGDNVQFLGELSDADLINCYQQCDLFVLPNRQLGGDIEGFGIALVEAQACGKAVVAGDSGGTRETMQIPTTGLVVDCDTPSALEKLVIELLGDRARLEAMGEAARRWAVSQFDWEARSQEAKAVFDQQILASQPSRSQQAPV